MPESAASSTPRTPIRTVAPTGGPLFSAFKTRAEPDKLPDHGWASAMLGASALSGAQSSGPPSSRDHRPEDLQAQSRINSRGQSDYGGNASTIDLGRLPWQIQAVLESHKASIENLMREHQERSFMQTNEQLTSIRKQVESMGEALHVANTAQRLQTFAERLEVMQQQQQQAMRMNKSGASPDGVPADVRQVVEECMGRLQKQQEAQIEKLHSIQLSQIEVLMRGEKAILCEPPEQEKRLTREDRAIVAQDAAADQAGDRPRRPSLTSLEDQLQLQAMRNDAMAMKKSYTGFNKRPDKPLTMTERAKQIMEKVSAFLILANMIWMTVEIEVGMASVRNGTEMPEYLFWANIGFAVAFSTELLIKLVLYRTEFCFGPQRNWNLFDVVLVVFQVVDLVFSTANLSFFRILRGLRAIRAARIMRTVKVVRELRLMMASIACSMGSLFWAFVLLILVLFLCAMGVQQTVQSSLEQQGLQGQHPRLMELYGTLPLTMLSLFMAISGGMDWKDLAAPLEQISKMYLIVYIFFVIMVVFGMLNILTAVFVEATANIAQVDMDLVLDDRLDNETSAVSQLKEMLVEADVDETGTISTEKFAAKLEDPKFRAQLNMLDLNIFEAQSVFRLLDVDCSNAVEIEDLVYGLMRLKGNARAMDMATMIYENKRLLSKLVTFIRMTNANFEELRMAVGSSPRPRLKSSPTRLQSVQGDDGLNI